MCRSCLPGAHTREAARWLGPGRAPGPAPLLALVVMCAPSSAHAAPHVESSAREDGIRELTAAGLIQAPPEVVFRVVCDVRLFRELVPYLSRLQVLDEDAAGALAYQRLQLPALAPRDFTVRHACATRRASDGSLVWTNRWRTDNDAGPPRAPGIVRLEVNEGSWTLVSRDGGAATYATYRLRVDPGGEVPQLLLHAALELQLPQLFRSLERVCQRLCNEGIRCGAGASPSGERKKP